MILQAFFHGMRVVLCPAWGLVAQRKQRCLRTPAGLFDVRERKARDGRHRQLCLNDLADGLLWEQPADAWCIMGLTM